MKNMMTAGVALLLTTTMATAGGLDRTGQGIDIIFEDGNYAELNFGLVSPSITATAGPFVGGGSIAPDYNQVSLGLRTQVNDDVALALIIEQPFGAEVSYPGGAPAATVETLSVTALGQYQINDNFSAHAGLRMVQSTGSVNVGGYVNEYGTGRDLGYVIGGAYERPEIAMRVALTYSSAVTLETQGELAPAGLVTELPQSVNLDFQTGVAPGTLVFGSIRWVEWSEGSITDSLAGELWGPDNNSTTYNIGVGRQFTDNFAGSVSIGYEEAQGGIATPLAPTDGNVSLQIGGAYTMDNGVKVSGGIRYVKVGDATAPTGLFEDNSVLGVGLSIGMSF